MTRSVAAGVLLAVLVATLAGPTVQGLALVEDTETGDHREIRVALDRGELEAKALSGQPKVDDGEVPATWIRVGDEPRPWQGFEQTVVLKLEGTGRLMLADEASGLVIEFNTTDRSDGDPPGHDHGDGADPAGGPSAGQGTVNGTAAPGSPASEATEGQSLTEIPGMAMPASTSPEAQETEKGGSVDWLLVALVVGLGLVAVAPAMAGPIKRRLWQLGSVLRRIRRRHQRQGPRKP